jgi:hypothetical protein
LVLRFNAPSDFFTAGGSLVWRSQPRMTAEGLDCYLQEVVTWGEEISTWWRKERVKSTDPQLVAFATGLLQGLSFPRIVNYGKRCIVIRAWY